MEIRYKNNIILSNTFIWLVKLYLFFYLQIPGPVVAPERMRLIRKTLQLK